MYSTVLHFDDEMLVTPHCTGDPATNPHYCACADSAPGGIFDTYATHFEDVWATSTRWSTGP